MKREIEAKLQEWKNKPANVRKPLILNGARQVGKTYTLLKFGEEKFVNTVYVNLERTPAAVGFFDKDLAPERLLHYLGVFTGEKITPGDTLIIFDEIQSSERALTSLKYFSEELPQYHIAAAGSLLGVAINREQFSFPVGKVETLMMYPLNFREYLQARGRDALLAAIEDSYNRMSPMPEPLHTAALELYREYLVVGGMPATARAFLATGCFVDAAEIQAEILEHYIADMAKYASASESVKIRACYNSIPAQLAKENHKFQYKLLRRGSHASDYGSAIEWLLYAGAVQRSGRVLEGKQPLSASEEISAFKLYFGDVGLLTAKSGLQRKTILTGENTAFTLALTENYVAQQLVSKGYKLYYWENKNKAGVDFVIQNENGICAITIKRTDRSKSRSLSVFAQACPDAQLVRLSLKNFSKKKSVRKIPLYATFML